MSNYNFAAHAASDHRKWVVVTISILLIIAVIVTGVLTDWFVNWNKYCLFGHDYGEEGICTRCGAEKPDEVQETPEDMAGGMVSESGVNAGIAFLSMNISRDEYSDYGIMAIAESAKQLTATVSPVTVTDNKLDWSVEFANPSSEWATGKNVTDYVTVTPTADGALTANVQCLKAFGEQIIVVARSRQDPGIWGTATIDYVKRVTSINLTLAPNAATFGATYNVNAVPVYGDGTLTGTFTQTDYSVKLTDSIANALVGIAVERGAVSSTQVGRPETVFYATYVSKSSASISADIAGHSFTFSGNDAYDVFSDGEQECSVATAETGSLKFPTDSQAKEYVLSLLRAQVNNKFLEAVKAENGNHITFSLGYTYNYSGVVSDSKTVTYGLRFDPSSLIVHVTGITFDKNLVF